MSDLLRVTIEINGTHPIHEDYPLLPGDVLTLNRDGTYTKHTGLCITGFKLNSDQAATLVPEHGELELVSMTTYLKGLSA